MCIILFVSADIARCQPASTTPQHLQRTKNWLTSSSKYHQRFLRLQVNFRSSRSVELFIYEFVQCYVQYGVGEHPQCVTRIPPVNKPQDIDFNPHFRRFGKSLSFPNSSTFPELKPALKLKINKCFKPWHAVVYKLKHVSSIVN